jgi:predicted Zn-dependent peptidase
VTSGAPWRHAEYREHDGRDDHQYRSLSKNFGATLDLMADVALRPSFPADEIERQRASRLGQLVQQRDNPGQVAAQMAVALWIASSVRY